MSTPLDVLRARTRAKILMGGCSRCGREREDKSKKNCVKCRAYYRGRRRATEKELFYPNAASKCELDRVNARIDRLELKLENMRRLATNAYKRGWYRGATAAAKNQESAPIELPIAADVGYDELSQISHVYQR